MPVILMKAGASVRKLDPEPLTDEKLLQKYVVEDPSCLPIEEIDDDLRLIIVAKDFPAGSGFIDALGVDQAGAIYIIETKLYRNVDKRRLLGQVLDYGSGLWAAHRNSAEFMVKLEENARRTFKRSARARIEKEFVLNADEANRLLATAADNIVAGRFNFIVLADHIDDNLKNLIAFVNANTVFTIYGVELQVYGIDEQSVLAIPRLHGAEAPKSALRHGSGPVADEAFFEQAAQTMSPEGLSALRALYQFSTDVADVVEWGRGATGSFNPKFTAISPKSLYTAYSDGRLYVNLRGLGGTESGRMAVDILAKGLRGLGCELPSDFRERFVRVEADWWVPRLEEFKKIFGSAAEIVPK